MKKLKPSLSVPPRSPKKPDPTAELRGALRLAVLELRRLIKHLPECEHERVQAVADKLDDVRAREAHAVKNRNG